jgi:hypothetical protein
MAQIFFQASDYPVGTTLEDLGFEGNARTVMSDNSQTTFTVTNTSIGKVFRGVASSGTNPSAKTNRIWKYIGQGVLFDEQEIYLLGKNGNGGGSVFYATTKAEATRFVNFSYSSNPSIITSSQYRIFRQRNNDTLAAVGSASAPFGSSDYGCLRLYAGSFTREDDPDFPFKSRAWVPSDPADPTANEPATWDLTNTRSDNSSGYVGVGATDAAPVDLIAIGIGSDGDSAPTAPVPPLPTATKDTFSVYETGTERQLPNVTPFWQEGAGVYTGRRFEIDVSPTLISLWSGQSNVIGPWDLYFGRFSFIHSAAAYTDSNVTTKFTSKLGAADSGKTIHVTYGSGTSSGNIDGTTFSDGVTTKTIVGGESGTVLPPEPVTITTTLDANGESPLFTVEYANVYNYIAFFEIEIEEPTGPNTPINPAIINLQATSARLTWDQG